MLSVSRPVLMAAAITALVGGCGEVDVPGAVDDGGATTDAPTETSPPVCRDVCGTPDCGECPTSPMVDVGGYRIDATEVTTGAYKAFFATHPVVSGVLAPSWPDCSEHEFYLDEYAKDDADDLPIAWVSWCDAYGYCAWARMHLCGKIGGGHNTYEDFADPTKSEWFNACSAGGTLAYPYGNAYEPKTCNGADDGDAYKALRVGDAPCEGGFPGLWDMSGNVMEWENSCSPVTSTPACRRRGGTFYDGEFLLRCSADDNADFDAGGPETGFRCCN